MGEVPQDTPTPNSRALGNPHVGEPLREFGRRYLQHGDLDNPENYRLA